jgi:hypothetical protein
MNLVRRDHLVGFRWEGRQAVPHELGLTISQATDMVFVDGAFPLVALSVRPELTPCVLERAELQITRLEMIGVTQGGGVRQLTNPALDLGTPLCRDLIRALDRLPTPRKRLCLPRPFSSSRRSSG